MWLKRFGEIKKFRHRVTEEAAEYRARRLQQMTESDLETEAKKAWRIAIYQRALKQQCLIERAQLLIRLKRKVFNIDLVSKMY